MSRAQKSHLRSKQFITLSMTEANLRLTRRVGVYKWQGDEEQDKEEKEILHICPVVPAAVHKAAFTTCQQLDIRPNLQVEVITACKQFIKFNLAKQRLICLLSVNSKLCK